MWICHVYNFHQTDFVKLDNNVCNLNWMNIVNLPAEGNRVFQLKQFLENYCWPMRQFYYSFNARTFLGNLYNLQTLKTAIIQQHIIIYGKQLRKHVTQRCIIQFNHLADDGQWMNGMIITRCNNKTHTFFSIQGISCGRWNQLFYEQMNNIFCICAINITNNNIIHATMMMTMSKLYVFSGVNIKLE